MFGRPAKLTKFGIVLAVLYAILTPILLAMLLVQNGWLAILAICYGLPLVTIILSCKLGKTIAYFFKKSTMTAIAVFFAIHLLMLGFTFLLFFLMAKIEGDSYMACMDICSYIKISEAAAIIGTVLVVLSLPAFISLFVYLKKFRNPRVAYDIDEIIRRTKELQGTEEKTKKQLDKE